MAINKVVNKSTKSHGAMRNVIEYVLKDEKVKDGYVEITGPFNFDQINWDTVYRTFLDEKKLWDKDSGRMYAHNVISFHKDEVITPEQCLEIGREFVERFFPEHQSLISIHQDRDHLHIHIVTNSVSYIDGMKLHQTKRDLEQQKQFTNQLCLERGLTIAEKGKHFDGTAIEEGEVIAWSKDKYNLLQNETKRSFVADCAIAVLEAREQCTSKEEFIERMEERGWHTSWSDSKKHITFQNDNGDKVRDSNLEKSFHIDVNKEALLHEFERQNEILRLAKLKSDRDRERAEELDKYYREADSAITGAGADCQAVGGDTEITDRVSGDQGTERDEDTEALVREVRADISDNRTQNRVVANTENKSISDAEQRRIEEEQRLAAQERAREIEGHSYSHSGPSR
ncbi:MAG: relaxase/mobilization nuclease domain-containing protein [Bacillota bacterium]|nr:relaxase/mobilization nuclease domain-containing protein [Bacillota bacterium]